MCSIIIKKEFSSIDTIQLHIIVGGSAMGGYNCYITIDQTGKVLLAPVTKESIKEKYYNANSNISFDSYYDSFVSHNPYNYKVEYQIDKSLVDDLNKTIKDNYLAFFQSAKQDRSVMDGRKSEIYVKLNNDWEFKKVGYESKNVKFNNIKDKIIECITLEDNGEKFNSFCRELEERVEYL